MIHTSHPVSCRACCQDTLATGEEAASALQGSLYSLTDGVALRPIANPTNHVSPSGVDGFRLESWRGCFHALVKIKIPDPLLLRFS